MRQMVFHKQQPLRTDRKPFQQLPLDGIFNGENEDYFGHDELSTAWSAYTYDVPDQPMLIGYQGCYMADDFADLVDTPVIQIKWWGSYLENYNDPGVTQFMIVLYWFSVNRTNPFHSFETFPAFGRY